MLFCFFCGVSQKEASLYNWVVWGKNWRWGTMAAPSCTSPLQELEDEAGITEAEQAARENLPPQGYHLDCEIKTCLQPAL